MILADKISQDIIGGNYFQMLFTKCMEFSYYQTLNIDSPISYTDKEYKDFIAVR